MLRALFLLILALPLPAQDAKAEAEARRTMDEFMAAFNARDVEAWAATLNYPHVRFASNQVRVWKDAEEFVRDNRNYPERLAPWHHSRWDEMKVIQSGPDKVHFAVTFQRFEASGKEMAKFPSLYIVTRKDGHWGVQTRSSFAP